MKSILIIKLSSLGDIVHSTAVVHHLKDVTQARVTWVVDEGFADLLEGHPDVDELFLFPRDPFRSKSVLRPLPFRQLISLVRCLRKRTFDVAIDFQGRGRSYLLLQVSNARAKIGRGNFPFLTDKVLHRRDLRRHAVEACFESTDLLGIGRPDDMRPYLPCRNEDRRKVSALLKDIGVCPPIASLLPFSSWVSKEWETECWIELADWLIDRGWTVVVAGSSREKARGTLIKQSAKIREKVFILCGELSLRELTALFQFTDLAIGVDTGPLHLASTSDTQILGLYGPTDPGRTGPRPRFSDQVRIVQPPDCEVCRHPRCRQSCMKNIKPGEVCRTLSSLLTGFT
jgi:ADP-heptose:LPS heptosyltransferase